MKILRIIHSVNPEGGGPIEGIKQQSKIAAALGHSTEVLCLDDPDRQFVKDFPLPIHAMGPTIGKYGFTRRFKPWLLANCRNYDVIIINGIWQYNSFAAHKVLKSQNVPYYLFTHGMLDPWFKRHYPLKHLKKNLYWFWGEYPVLRDAERVFFTCEEERFLARQSFWPYRCNEYVVNYGTAGHIGDDSLAKTAFLERFPALKNKRFMLFLSRIHPKKGIDLLIEAFGATHSKQPDLHLVIAGPDQIGWQSQLEKLAEEKGVADKIIWTGMLSGDLKWGAYLCAETFILPSHAENFGIVVAEALSCSLPVLISDKVNIWQEIKMDNAGIIAEDTVEGCAQLITNWLALDQAERENMRQNAKTCFMRHFEINAAVSSLLDVFSKDKTES